MQFARRLLACVLAIASMSVLAALAWDNSDQVAVQATESAATATVTR